MARRLKTIAKEINETIPELNAAVEQGFYSTDRKVGRLRWPGKGREGNRILIRAAVACNGPGRAYGLSTQNFGPGEVVFDHNSADPLRANSRSKTG